MAIPATPHSAKAADGIPSALRISGERWAVEGAITFETVAALEAALDASRASPNEVNLRDTTHVDSSAVAFLVAIKRRHPQAKFTDIPSPLVQLTDLYGVRDLVL